MTTFRIEPYSLSDKMIHISGPNEIDIYVDYDDVDHPVVERFVKRLVGVMNTMAPGLVDGVELPR
jgi:hypothetical protein